MKHLVTADEAELVRWIAANGPPPAEMVHSWRLFLPPAVSSAAVEEEAIGVVEASGRAHCRACGERIEKGAPAIVFGFDALATPEAPSTRAWGSLARAYLHEEPCPTTG